MHQELNNEDNQRIQDPNLETALLKPAESDLAYLRVEIVSLQEENKSLHEQNEQLKIDLQQARDRVHIYEDTINQTVHTLA